MSRVFTSTSGSQIITSTSAPINNLPAFTLAAWIYPTALNGSGTVVAKYPPNAFSPGLVTIGNDVYGQVVSVLGGVNGSNGNSVEIMPIGAWSHMAMTFDFNGDKTVHLYLNGTEVTYAGPHNAIVGAAVDNSSGGFYMGKDGFGNNLDGYLAEVVEYNVVLTPTQVLALAKSTTGATAVLPGNIVGYWHLLGTQSPEPDSSGNGNDGVLSEEEPVHGPNSPGYRPQTTYTGSQKITIDYTKVGASDSTNFPFLFSGTYAYLATIANGGSVTSATGYDIIFTSDSQGQHLLNWEIESYDPVTGKVNFWIKIPNLSHSQDTAIYMLYGNPDIVFFEGGAVGSVWDAGFQGVWHLPNGSSLSVVDSTSNGAVTTNHSATANTGKIDGGGAFVAASNEYIDSAVLNSITAVTVEAWIKTSTSATGNGAFIINNDNLSTHRAFQFRLNATTNFLNFISFTSLSGVLQALGNVALNDGVFHHVVGTYDGAHAVCYVDGHAQDTVAGTLTLGVGTGTILFGAESAGTNTWDGSLDELRMSSVARGADWVLAEYNNQNSPSTFYAVTTNVIAGLRFIGRGKSGPPSVERFGLR